MSASSARGLPCVGGLQDLAHVARNAGEAEQPALLVEQLLDLRGGQPFRAFEEREHAGIDVAAARAHDEPLGGREAHRRVDRAAVIDGAERRAVAEMAAHQLAARSAGA